MKVIAIITTKNRPELFRKAYTSIIKQSKRVDEIIVVSDSFEESKEIEKKIVGNSGIIIEDAFTHNYAGSLNTAINYIIKNHLYLAHDFDDVYFATLDDDDYWYPSYIEKCVSAVRNNEDFVISGLIYGKENGNINLSIPHKVTIDDFLKGNPHIQGSNTFIKFSTLLKAGAFDENMSSTTDRDLFTRVMMLNPSYAIIDEHLVYVNAHNDRERITNGIIKKTDGLNKFYYKYGCIMSPDVNTAFFNRAKELFGIEESAITVCKSESLFKRKPLLNRYGGNLVIGFIATEYELGLRLLSELCALERKQTHVIVLVNFTNPINEYADVLERSGYRFDIITHERIRSHVRKSCDQFIENELLESPVIKDIAVSRSILQRYMYELSNDGDALWVLDDDMELKELAVSPNGIIKEPIDIDLIIEEYRDDYDAVVGNYSLDAPLPTLSTLRCALLDYTYSKLGFHRLDNTMDCLNDYYYDLSDANRKQLETPLYLPKETALNDVFSGKAYSRPLIIDNDEIKSVKSRGGNTLIFNRDLLKIPNWSLQISDKIGRRSDYFWALQAEMQGYKLANVPFAVLHNRRSTDFDLKKEQNKLLLDLIGSSFTKAVEEIGIDGSKQNFYNAYKKHFTDRLAMYYASYYRIVGLLEIIGEEYFSSMMTISNLGSFIKETETYLVYESVVTAYESLKYKCDKQQKMTSKSEIEKWITRYFSLLQPLTLLGNGGEGIVFTDGKCVYKHFFSKPKNWAFLQTVSARFVDCKQLYPIECISADNHFIIKYPYDESVPYKGDYNKDMAELLRFCKKTGFVFTNIKKNNFVVSDGTLKLIDYGKSFEPYTEELYERSISRAYELLRYPFLNDEEFKQLIQLYYLGKTAAIDSGVENFRQLVNCRYKEGIHDEIICDLINKYKPHHILDYGAGKCKIANSLCDKYDFSAFDIDVKTMENRADKSVKLYTDYNEIPDSSIDMILSNLVLCCVDNDTAEVIVNIISEKLSLFGRALFSICNPFFNNVNHTELREKGLDVDYDKASVFVKQNKYGSPIRNEYHRPIEYYINLFTRFGFEIENVIESNGVDVDTLLQIGEHLVFDCKLIKKNSQLSDCSLLIKTNPMDAKEIYANIKHIVLSLEKQVRFAERIVVVDSSSGVKRARTYAEDNIELLSKNLDKAVKNGLIDRVVYVQSNNDIVPSLYQKYFGFSANNEHAANGQGLYATLYGFEQIKTPYVFQTDSDILYHINTFKDVYIGYNAVKSGAVTASLSIPHDITTETQIGCRTEVRSCFLNLELLKEKLPLKNSVKDGILQLPWHRSLDASLLPDESVRLSSIGTWFIHPENDKKTIPNYVGRNRFFIEQNIIPKIQYNLVNVAGTMAEWCPKVNADIILYVRGYNTSCEKLKRLFASIKSQTLQDFVIVYVDDASASTSRDYAQFIFKHDSYFKNKVIALFNDKNVGELDNFVFVMKNIVTDDNSIVINIDNDDYLVANNALEKILSEFENGAEITCGNCCRYDKPLKRYKIYSFDKVWERGGDNIWLHPKCFRRKLFNSIDVDSDLKIDGKYVDVNTDFAFMLPMINSAKKCVFIDDVIYYFEPSIDNQKADGKYAKERKNAIKKILLQKAEGKYGRKV